MREEEGAPPSGFEEWLDKLLSGHVQPAPGWPLLAKGYRGNRDYYSTHRVFVVLDEGRQVAAFHNRADAERWVAWFVADRQVPVERFRVAPIPVMEWRRIPPLFAPESAS